MDGLLASKIQKPAPVERWISSENMNGIKKEAVHSKVLFIDAPTGYGKTTFLTHWSNTLEETVAWLTIDKTDDSAIGFFKYIVYSIYEASHLLSKSELENKMACADRENLKEMWLFYKKISNQLEKPIRLIIDNFHHIQDPELLEMIQYFVIDLPSSMKVCFAGRHSPPFPLALWQSMFSVTEVHMHHLRFTEKDTATYLNQQANQQESAGQIFSLTEGWPAGLACAVRQEKLSDKKRAVEQFAMNILENDLWNDLSVPVQNFLLATSILETVNERIADELLDHKESMEYLDILNRNGFFMESTVEADLHYRYHPLLRNALQVKLQKAFPECFIARLHKHAVGMFYRQGNMEQAITHALKGNAYPLASTLMMNYKEKILGERRTAIFASWCHEFGRKDILLPMELQLLYSFSLLAEGEVEKAERVVQNMTQAKNKKEWNHFTKRAKSAAYDYFLIRSYLTIIQMKEFVEIGCWLKKVLDFRTHKSESIFDLPLQLNKKEPVLSRTKLVYPKKADSEEHPRAGVHFSFRQNKNAICGYYHGVLAESLYMKGYLKDAVNEHMEAFLTACHFQDPGLLIPMYILRCKLYLANGETKKAQEHVQIALAHTQDPYWKGFLHAFHVYIHLKEKNLQLAEEEFLKIPSISTESLQQNPFIALVEAGLLLEKDQWETALENTLRVKFKAQQEGQIVTYIEAAVLESVCHFRRGDQREMVQALQEAIFSCKEYGYPQLLLEDENMEAMLTEYSSYMQDRPNAEWSQVPYFYIDHLLEATQEKKLLYELLTPQERDAHSLLVLGETNKKIAKNLVLTEGNVQIRLTSICERLSINSRTQAMLKAYK